ncbi:hypothetical protein S83_043654 [Arachis hypogaea]|nr:Leucine-rich repeat receptor-like protein kinase TDR [Arachis hypogaea]
MFFLFYFILRANMCLSFVLAENKFAVRSGAKTSGDLPQFESCKSISIIDLDKNNLSGTILNSFSKCQALEKLNLSNNNMIGHIPEELASIPVLSVIDLSNKSMAPYLKSLVVLKVYNFSMCPSTISWVQFQQGIHSN